MIIMDENTKFEYKIITRDKMFPMSSAELNGYGMTRWQLVQIVLRDNQLDYIFMRIQKKSKPLYT